MPGRSRRPGRDVTQSPSCSWWQPPAHSATAPSNMWIPRGPRSLGAHGQAGQNRSCNNYFPRSYRWEQESQHGCGRVWRASFLSPTLCCAHLAAAGPARSSRRLPRPGSPGSLPSFSGSPSLLWYSVPSYSIAVPYRLESLKKTQILCLDFFPHSHLYDFQTLVHIPVVRATFLCFKYFTHLPFRSSLEAHFTFLSAFGMLASQEILHVLSEQLGEGKGSDFPPGPATQSSYAGTVDVGKAEDPLPSLGK